MATYDEAYKQYQESAQGQAVAGMHDAQRQANLARMEEEYNRNRSQQEADAAKIPGMYREQGNDLNAQYERNRRNFLTAAAANGINTGAASQAQLAQNAAYQKAYGQIGAAQATAQTEAQRQLANLESAYRSQVNAAIADSDYQKAAAMLQGYQDDRQRQMDEAKLMASYGNFDLYGQLYGPEAASSMRQIWIAQNPLLAYNTGAITAAQYRKMTGKNPPGVGGSGGYGGGGRRRSGGTTATTGGGLSGMMDAGMGTRKGAAAGVSGSAGGSGKMGTSKRVNGATLG